MATVIHLLLSGATASGPRQADCADADDWFRFGHGFGYASGYGYGLGFGHGFGYASGYGYGLGFGLGDGDGGSAKWPQ